MEEERVPPSVEKAQEGPTSEERVSSNDEKTEDPIQENLPGLQSETYVVQVPKDQIYRVPPPENALIAEKHRNPAHRKRSHCPCFCWIFAFGIIFALILGLIAGISYIVIKPNAPQFYIKHVLLKNPHSQSHSHPVYDIKMKANNPNGHVGILYDHGNVSLAFRKQKIASGKYPCFYQSHENSTVLDLMVRGLNTRLPREIERSMTSKKTKLHISLSLSINVSVNLNLFEVFKTERKKLEVLCNFTLNTLGKNTRIVAQKCTNNL